jgi:MHS family proline/betaine transporter-like MFS transporter
VRTEEPGVRRVGFGRVIVASSIGTFIELYDLFIYGYFASILAGEFFPRQDPNAALLATFAIFAVGFLVRPIGAVIFGHVGDRLGRRAALTFSLLLMTVATVAFAALPTYTQVGLLAPVLLLLCRIAQGLSASAELTGSQLLVQEHAPHGWRGRAVAVNIAAGNLGTGAAASAGLILAHTVTPEQLAAWGWRVAFLVAAPIGLVGLYVRTRLMDSPAFLALGDGAKHGRAPLTRALGTARNGMVVLFAWAAACVVCSYLLAGYLPSYLIRTAGLSPAQTFTASVVAVLTLATSTLLGGYFADRFPLRPLAIVVMTGVAVTALPGLAIITHFGTLAAALVGQSMWAMFLGAAFLVQAMMSVALFPTTIRFTATAVPQNLAASMFGGTAPYLSTWLVAGLASPIAPGFYLFAVVIVGLIAAIFGVPRQRAADA